MSRIGLPGDCLQYSSNSCMPASCYSAPYVTLLIVRAPCTMAPGRIFNAFVLCESGGSRSELSMQMGKRSRNRCGIISFACNHCISSNIRHSSYARAGFRPLLRMRIQFGWVQSDVL